MFDVVRVAAGAHPVAGEQAALGVPDEDDLFRAGDCAYGFDIGPELHRGFFHGGGAALSVVRGEHTPAVGTQFGAEFLPHAFRVDGAVDQDHRPGFVCGGAVGPIVFENAAWFEARTQWQVAGGIEVVIGFFCMLCGVIRFVVGGIVVGVFTAQVE